MPTIVENRFEITTAAKFLDCLRTFTGDTFKKDSATFDALISFVKARQMAAFDAEAGLPLCTEGAVLAVKRRDPTLAVALSSVAAEVLRLFQFHKSESVSNAITGTAMNGLGYIAIELRRAGYTEEALGVMDSAIKATTFSKK